MKDRPDSHKVKEPELREKLSRLMDSQGLAALSSEGEGQPYLNLVAFAASKDLREIYFPTPRETRKFANLTRNPRAAMMVDNRAEMAGDLGRGMAVTALGRVRELDGDTHGKVKHIFLGRHPGLEDLAVRNDTAWMCLEVERYVCVLGVDQVAVLEMG